MRQTLAGLPRLVWAFTKDGFFAEVIAVIMEALLVIIVIGTLLLLAVRISANRREKAKNF